MNGYSPSGFTGYGAIPSISTPIGTTPIGGGSSGMSGSLEALIADAIRRKNAPIEMGSNRVPIGQNQVTSGYIDRMGSYHRGEGPI